MPAVIASAYVNGLDRIESGSGEGRIRHTVVRLFSDCHSARRLCGRLSLIHALWTHDLDCPRWFRVCETNNKCPHLGGLVVVAGDGDADAQADHRSAADGAEELTALR